MKPIPTISAEAEILANILAKGDELVTYQTLTDAIKRDVQDGARGMLTTARRKVAREKGIVYVVVRGVGLKRARGMVFSDICEQATTGIRRKGKRVLKDSLRMPEDEYAALPNADKIALNTNRTILGTVAHFANGAARKQIEGACEVQNSRLAIGQVLEVCKG